MAVEYPEILTDLGEHLAEKLEGRGMEAKQPSDLVFAVTGYLRRFWGGQEVYVPMAEHLEQAGRDQRIYEHFFGGGPSSSSIVSSTSRNNGFARSFGPHVCRAARRSSNLSSPWDSIPPA